MINIENTFKNKLKKFFFNLPIKSINKHTKINTNKHKIKNNMPPPHSAKPTFCQ